MNFHGLYRLSFYLMLTLATLSMSVDASDSPIAIACLRLLTFLPLLDFRVPFLRRRIALSTRFEAASCANAASSTAGTTQPAKRSRSRSRSMAACLRPWPRRI